jgi:hypothetical protein
MEATQLRPDHNPHRHPNQLHHPINPGQVSPWKVVKASENLMVVIMHLPEMPQGMAKGLDGKIVKEVVIAVDTEEVAMVVATEEVEVDTEEVAMVAATEEVEVDTEEVAMVVATEEVEVDTE